MTCGCSYWASVDRANPKEVSPHGRSDIEGLSVPQGPRKMTDRPQPPERKRDTARHLHVFIQKQKRYVTCILSSVWAPSSAFAAMGAVLFKNHIQVLLILNCKQARLFQAMGCSARTSQKRSDDRAISTTSVKEPASKKHVRHVAYYWTEMHEVA